MSSFSASELSLEQQRERLELVIEGTRLGMWDWNPQTNEVAFNDIWAEMLGYQLDQIEPSLTAWESRVHADDLANCYADIQAHMEGKTPFYENVHRMRHRDGHWVYILDRGKIVERDASGRPIRFTGTHTDISKQKHAEIEALKATRAKSRFLANMSHEIRTPLSGVLGVIHLLEATALDADQQSYVDIVRECGEGLLTIINDILDFSKIEVEQLSIDPHPFDLMRALRLVHGLYLEQALAKGLTYELTVEPDVPERVVADSHRLKQIVMNLLSNAVKFTGEGAVRLVVGARRHADDRCDFTIRVQDTGKGIADPDAIWKSFEQEDASISRQYGGTGLGLAICRSLVELMGGSIDVSSEPGVGSEFTLQVPVAVAAPEAESAGAADLVSTNLPRLDVLVAEDNAVSQLVIAQLLRNLGMSVTLAGTGQEALERCREQRFHLVFMDVHMPQMSGVEATRAIRSLPDIVQPPIVALSAEVLREAREECLAAGMNGFLCKPFRIHEIILALRQAVDDREELAA